MVSDLFTLKKYFEDLAFFRILRVSVFAIWKDRESLWEGTFKIFTILVDVTFAKYKTILIKPKILFD